MVEVVEERGLSASKVVKHIAKWTFRRGDTIRHGILVALIAVLGYFVLNQATFGRWIYATGGNPISAWLSGIEIRRIQQ